MGGGAGTVFGMSIISSSGFTGGVKDTYVGDTSVSYMVSILLVTSVSSVRWWEEVVGDCGIK